MPGATYMEGDYNSIHGCRVVRDRPWTIRIGVCLQHLADNIAESIHREASSKEFVVGVEK